MINCIEQKARRCNLILFSTTNTKRSANLENQMINDKGLTRNWSGSKSYRVEHQAAFVLPRRGGHTDK
jgi:hypothetical protein